MDLNADGHRDIITGCYVGVPYVAWGAADGLKAPEQLPDREGGLMHLGRYWCYERDEHVYEGGFNERAYSAFPCDWDEDGDLDLLIGGDGGGFYLRHNEGSANEPKFATEATPVPTANGPAKVERYAMPLFVDWDGDGLRDLISGQYDGAVIWYRNEGEAGKPQFASPKTLVTSAAAEALGRGERSQIEVTDWDGDGDMDLLVGDLHMNYLEEESRFDNHGWIWLYEREPTLEAKTDAIGGGGSN